MKHLAMIFSPVGNQLVGGAQLQFESFKIGFTDSSDIGKS